MICRNSNVCLSISTTVLQYEHSSGDTLWSPHIFSDNCTTVTFKILSNSIKGVPSGPKALLYWYLDIKTALKPHTPVHPLHSDTAKHAFIDCNKERTPRSTNQRCFVVLTPQQWNKLPVDFRAAETLHSFHQRVKSRTSRVWVMEKLHHSRRFSSSDEADRTVLCFYMWPLPFAWMWPCSVSVFLSVCSVCPLRRCSILLWQQTQVPFWCLAQCH